MDYVSRLKARKSELGMTNEQLSAISGVPMGTLSKLLAGMNDSPKLGNLAALCRALRLSLDYVVWGTPENTHNYTLDSEEITLIERYRALDQRGRKSISMLAETQMEFTGQAAPAKEPEKESRRAVRLQTPTAISRFLPLYELPVSAGTGSYLDDTSARQIRVPDSASPAADYLLRISGNSMEPKYHDSDLLLVERTEQVSRGEVGIFILDGEGYVKVWGGDCLISLNPEYRPIPISPTANLQCCGRVVGRMKAKKKV